MKHTDYCAVALTVVLLSMAQDLCAARDVVKPSAIDRRWVYLNPQGRLTDKAMFAKATNIVATAASHGFTGVMFASSLGLTSLRRWSDARKEALSKLVALVDSLGLEKGVAMWSAGYPKESFFPIDQNLSAANPVFGTRYRVENGKCIYVRPPVRRIVDSPATIHSPRQNGDLSALKVKVSPRKAYRLTVKAKSSADVKSYPLVVEVRRPGDGGNFIEHHPFSVKGGEAQTVVTDFSSMDLDEIEIVCCGHHRHHAGSAQIVSMELSEMPPIVAIRRHGTPIAVRDAETGFQYEEGRDFAAVPRATDAWPGDWIPPERRFAIRPLPGGRIKEGGEIIVDCYCPFPVWGKWQGACLGAVEMNGLIEESAAAVAETVKPRVWLLSLDEVRTGGGCKDCTAIGDMAHVYAAFVKKCMAAVRRRSPNAEFFIWNDMVDPYCLSAVSRKGEYCALYSRISGVWDLLPKDIGIAYWRLDDRDRGLSFFSRRGHRILAAAYYDAKTLNGSVKWAEAALATPSADGIMYCTWGDRWNLLAEFGDEMKRISREAKSENKR